MEEINGNIVQTGSTIAGEMNKRDFTIPVKLGSLEDVDVANAEVGDALVFNGESWIPQKATVTVDTELSKTSENPVQNKVITEEVEKVTTRLSQSEEYLKQDNAYDGTYTLGKNDSGNTNGARAIGSPIAIDGLVEVKKNVLPSTTSYRVSYYTSESLSSVIADSGSWITDSDTHYFNAPSNAKYARLYFARTDSATMSDSDFVGMDIRFCKGVYSNVDITAKLSTSEERLSHSNIDFKQYENLSNGYLQNNGSFVSSDAWRTTDYLKLFSLSKINFVNAQGNTCAICFFDKNKNFISGETYSNRSTFSVSIPSNAYYTRYSLSVDNVESSSTTVTATTITQELTPLIPFQNNSWLGNDEINISTYTPTNKYTAPSNGYACMSVGASETALLRIGSSNNSADFAIGGASGRYSVFVKKGMKLWKEGSGGNALFIKC